MVWVVGPVCAGETGARTVVGVLFVVASDGDGGRAWVGDLVAADISAVDLFSVAREAGGVQTGDLVVADIVSMTKQEQNLDRTRSAQ
jgi:hypothetical protein